MKKIINCKEANMLMSPYIDKKLDETESMNMEFHLSNCPICRNKYEDLKKFINKMHGAYQSLIETFKRNPPRKFNIKEYQFFIENISPYIDNELDFDNKLRFESIISKIRNSNNKINEMYLLKFIMQKSFKQLKASNNVDFSKFIIKKLDSERTFFQRYSKKFAKIAIMGCLMFFLFGAFYSSDINVEKVKYQIEHSNFVAQFVKNAN